MKYFLVTLIFISIINSALVVGQEQMSISESRKKNLRKVLDYRFKGGFYSFEKLFNTTVEYPEIAAQNCVLGIVIASFTVNCDGKIEKVSLKNPLKYMTDEVISEFFSATEGHWNTCDDEKYTNIDVPIQFTLSGTNTNTTDGLLIVEGETLGFDCYDDEKYLERAKKFLKKGKGKKALESINVLIQRNPFNSEYTDMKTKALSLL
jgi:hypothetical protein